jgi:hypothetical protein
MLPPHRCPHRNHDEDGWRVERDQGERVCYVLATCRDCGARLQQRWLMKRGGDWRVRRSDEDRRETA